MIEAHPSRKLLITSKIIMISDMEQKQIKSPFPLDDPEARKFWDNMSDAVKEVCAKYPPDIQYSKKSSPFPVIIRSYDVGEDDGRITVTISVLSPTFPRQVFGVDPSSLEPYHEPKSEVEALVKQVVVTKCTMGIPGVFGIASMQVCAQKDATDEEILNVCNAENPSGTRGGWSGVVREDEENYPGSVQCDDNEDRLHLIITC